MIVREFFKRREDGVKLFKTYSDADFYIQKKGTDEKYTCAIDIETAEFEYIETDEIIKSREEHVKLENRDTADEM